MNDNTTVSDRTWGETFYRDLQTLVDSTFPKVCTLCGKLFESKADFLEKTIPVKDINLTDRSGLFSLEGASDQPAIGLFRNCTCGTTLMADFRDRRDNSSTGQLLRQRFAALIDTLADKGVPRFEARRELLKVLHGEPSSRIAALLGEPHLT